MKKKAQNLISHPIGQSIGIVSSATKLPSLEEFLACGWLLQLNSRQILVGWGSARNQARNLAQNQSEPVSFQASLFAPPFYLEEATEASKLWRSTSNWSLVDRGEFISFVLAGVGHNVNASQQGFQWVEPSRGDFDKQWQEIRSGMQARGLQKAVPVVFARTCAELNSQRRLSILQNLVRLPASLFIYGYWSSTLDSGLLGATPEVLFTKIGEEPLETVALAGTRGKSTGPDAGEQLFNDPKERHEHQLVIDDIRSVLEKVGEVAVDETGVVELPTLFHLKTPIRVRLNRPMGMEMLARLMHPTPALGVAPRALGFTEMRRWENTVVDRRQYGAPFGAAFEFVDETTGHKTSIQHVLVAIRNIQWQGDDLVLGSGCGIVPASDPDREWQELSLKRESVKRMLGL